jgi:hypothetical protein
MEKNIFQLAREICTEVTWRGQKERYTDDVPEEILKRIPNLREQLAQMVEVAVESGFRREIAHHVFYDIPLPEGKEYRESRRDFAIQPEKMKKEFAIESFALEMIKIAARLEAERILETLSLPELVGSGKQIKWAETLREKALKQVLIMNGNIDAMVAQSSAKYWIENR